MCAAASHVVFSSATVVLHFRLCTLGLLRRRRLAVHLTLGILRGSGDVVRGPILGACRRVLAALMTRASRRGVLLCVAGCWPGPSVFVGGIAWTGEGYTGAQQSDGAH